MFRTKSLENILKNYKALAAQDFVNLISDTLAGKDVFVCTLN